MLTLPKNTEGRMLTLVEAADLLDMHPDTLRQQAGKGVLRARKVGRDWLVSPVEVQRYAHVHRKHGYFVHSGLTSL